MSESPEQPTRSTTEEVTPTDAPTELEGTPGTVFQQLPSLINYQVPGSPFSSGAVAAGFSRETLLAVQAASGRAAIDYLFDKSQVPPSGQDVTDHTLGTQFQVSQSGLSLLAISFYWNMSGSQRPTDIGVYDVNGNLLVSLTTSPPSTWGWVFTALPEPIPLTPDTPYWVVYQSSLHAYPQLANYTFPAASSPNGLVTILSGGSAAGSSLQMPAVDATCYFVDANIG